MLDMVDTTQQIKIIPLLGNRYPITETTAGRVLLAHNETVFNSLPKKERDLMTGKLAVIKEQGADSDRGGFGDGVASLAAPLMDADGNTQGCICMVGPEFRLTRKLIEESLLPKLIDAGIVISSKLGYVGHFIDKTIFK